MGDEEEEGGVSVLMAPPPSLHNHTSSNAPPPPPPPPLPMGVANPVERKRRVRSFYWKPIPEDRVNQQRGTNLWTLGRLSKEEIFHIDVSAIEELFGQHEETQSPTATSSRIRRERGSMKDFTEQITFLDSKRNMSISIFLKHFKRSGDSLLEDIRHGNADAFAVETLRELLKLLPEDEEVKNLQMFSGNIKDLNTADSFIYQLIHLPRYKVRLEALLVKVEYQPSYSAMKQEISIILAAIKELLNCEELHRILHLVLQAGNIINAGGYAGNAVGFKLSSLLSLADTKANRPRMNLLHFVALEAQKKHLLMFPEKLPHVQQAARVCVDSIHVEFSTLSSRVHEVEENIQEDSELLTQLQPFLKSAGEALEDLRVRCEEMTREGNALIDFFCEDKETFRLDECFQIFQDFCAKFRRAVQENQEREKWEASRRRRLKELEEKRHSWAGHEGVGGVFGLRCSSETDVEAALKREGLLGLLKTDPQSTQGPPQRFWSVRRSRQQISPESANPDMNFDPSGADTHILPPIHTLSITHTPTNAHTPSDSLSEGYVHSHDHTNANMPGNHDRSLKSEQEDNVMTFDPETPEKTSSIPETRNDTQTQTSQGQETLGKMEVTADLTFGPTKNGLEAEATSAACSQSESSTGGDERISATSQHDELNSLKTGREDAQSALIHANKPPSKTSTAKHTPSSHALKSSSILRSSPQRPVRTLTPSETQSLRKVVPITRPGSSGPKNQEQKTPNRSALNSASAKKRHVVRPPPEEKMCRATLRALSSPPPQNPTHNRHAPSFARNTVASATRHADVPGRQPAATTAPPLTRAASLRLSQLHRRQQSTPITPITPNTPNTPNTPITPITPSRTASVRLPHLTKNSSGFIENSQKSIRPAWK